MCIYMPKRTHFFFSLNSTFWRHYGTLSNFIKSVIILLICYISLKLLQGSGPLYLMFHDMNKTNQF